MINLGDFATSSIVYRDFTSISTAGVPTSLIGSPVVKVLKDDGTAYSTAGITLTTDLGGTVGLNNVKIDTSADGTFYSSGHDFSVVITTGTVNTNSVVGYVIATFSLQNRSAIRPTTAGRTLGVNAAGQVGPDWANIGSPTTAVDLSGTTIKNVDNAVPGVNGNVTGSVGSVTGNVGGNVIGSVGSVLGNVAGSVASVVGNIGGNVVGSVGSVVAAVSIAAGSITSIAQAVWDALTSASSVVGSFGVLVKTNLDALISSRAPASTALSTVQWTNARAALLDFLDVAVSSRAPAATALSTVQWTNARAAFLDFLDVAVSSRAPASTALSTAQWTNVRAALLDNLDSAVSSRAPAATALSTAQWTNVRAALLDFLDVAVSSRLAASSYVAPDNADITAIKAKTDNLPADPASNTQVNTRVSTSHFDTVIGTPSGASVSADIASIASAVALLQTAATALTQYNALLAAIGTPQQASTSLTQYNALQSAIALLQTASTALTQYNAIVSAIGSIPAPNNSGIAAIKAQTDKMLFDVNSFIKANAEITIDDANILAIKAKTDQLLFNIDTGVIAHVINETPVDPTTIAAAVWNAELVTYDTTGTFGGNAQNPPLDPTEIADAVWDALTADHVEPGTFGANVQAPSSGGGSIVIVGRIDPLASISGTVPGSATIVGMIDPD